MSEPGPKMLLESIRIYGTEEVPGADNSGIIMSWAKELGIKSYTTDAIPWCGLSMAIVAKRAGKVLPEKPLWARNWLKFGNSVVIPKLGDVLIFKRGPGGHVTLYVGEDETHYHGIGGNQSDSINITRLPKSSLLGARNLYKIAQPINCRVIHLSPLGEEFDNNG